MEVIDRNPLPYIPVPDVEAARLAFYWSLIKLYDLTNAEGARQHGDPWRDNEQVLDVEVGKLQLRLVITRELTLQAEREGGPRRPFQWLHVRAVKMGGPHRTVGSICQQTRLLIDRLRRRIEAPIMEHNTSVCPLLFYRVTQGDLDKAQEVTGAEPETPTP